MALLVLLLLIRSQWYGGSGTGYTGAGPAGGGYTGAGPLGLRVGIRRGLGPRTGMAVSTGDGPGTADGTRGEGLDGHAAGAEIGGVV